MTKKELNKKIDDLRKEFEKDTQAFARQNNRNFDRTEKIFLAMLSYLGLDLVKERVVSSSWDGEEITDKYTIVKAKKSKKAKK